MTAAQAAAAHHTRANELVAVLHAFLLERARHAVPTQPPNHASEELKVCAEAANEPGAQEVGIHFLGALAGGDFVGPGATVPAEAAGEVVTPGVGAPAAPVHAGSMIPGKMEGDASDMSITYLLQQGEADGPYHQTREGVTETTPIILGDMNALCLPAFFLRNWATPT